MQVGDTYLIQVWDFATDSPKSVTMKVVSVDENGVMVAEQVI
jgi:hypothetical protein